MSGSARFRSVFIAVAASLAVAACGGPPTGLCLGDEPVTVTLPRARFVQVSHEAESDLELARFVFEPAESALDALISVTAEPASPEETFLEARFDEPVSVQGDRLTSITIDDLVGGADSDRLRADPINAYAIREIVQVKDDDAARWIIGTAAGYCLRLNANEAAGLVVLAVTKD